MRNERWETRASRAEKEADKAKEEARTVVEIGKALVGEFPDEKRDDAQESDAACDCETDDG
jgi:hypothetical protein